jgi:hypothetical protein
MFLEGTMDFIIIIIDIFDEQRQYTILSLLAHPAVLRTAARLPMPLSVTAFVPTASGMVWLLSF